MRLLKDTRGQESTTLTFVTVSWLAVTFVFVVKGAAADMLNYGSAVALILAPWIGRELKAKGPQQ